MLNNDVTPVAGAEWVAPAAMVQAGPFHLDAGLFYFGCHLPVQDGGRSEPFLIDPSLPIAESGGGEASLGYWPDYAQMTPAIRHSYLKWIAGMRSDPDVPPGFVLLHLYALERRLLLENRLDEAPLLLNEVLRQSTLYKKHASIRKVVRNLVDACCAVLTGDIPVAPLTAAPERSSIAVRYAIGKALSSGQEPDPDHLFYWLASDTDRSVDFPPDLEVLRQAFVEHLRRVRPLGLHLDVSDAPLLQYTHVASCGSFKIDLTSFIQKVPDVAQSPRARLEAQVLLRDTIERLPRGLRAVPSRMAPLDHQLITRPQGGAAPPPVSPIMSPRQQEPFGRQVVQEWARKQLEAGAAMSVKAALKRLRGQYPKMLTRSELERLADVLAQVNIGLIPDPRFDLEPSRICDDALLFQLDFDADAQEPSSNYRSALLLAMICTSVARSDGQIASEEVDVTNAVLASFDLPRNEQLRLAAECEWIRMRPLPMDAIFNALETLTQAQKEHVKAIIIALARADKLLPEAEQQFALMLFHAMGFEAAACLHQLQDRLFETESPVAKDTATEELTVRIAVEAPALAPAAVSAPIEIPDGAFRGLDDKHAAFLQELLVQVEWNRRALEKIARSHRLMTDGALETLSDWAFDTFQEQLFEIEEESNAVRINQSIASKGLRSVA